MRTILFTVIAAIPLVSTAALAQQSPHSGGGPTWNAVPQGPMYGGSDIASSVGQSAHSGMPSFTVDPNAEVAAVPFLPPLNARGPMNTANSLPAGFGVGASPAYYYAQSTARYFANQGSPNRAVAEVGGQPRG